MNPERYQRLQALLQAALEREPNQRSAFLDEACDEDAALRSQIEDLIVSAERARSFLESPISEIAAHLVSDQSRVIIGQSFGSYRVLSLLGSGGMGDVYLAEDTRLRRKVALKLLRSSFTNDRDRFQRFEQEAWIISALNHPNILTIHEIASVDDTHLMVTEFVDGETLRRTLTFGQMDFAGALDIAAQIASALAAAHESGVVHRDIKPENIMVRRDGYVKVLDFGIAKLVKKAAAGETDLDALTKMKTNPGTLLGTVSYMSPEQARGAEVDARTDVWSLGVVLYEMLTAQVPFKGTTPSHVLVSIQDQEPAPLGLPASEFAVECERIVRKALAKQRAERYQSGNEFFADLKSLREDFKFKSKLNRSPMETPRQDSAASDAATPAAIVKVPNNLTSHLTPLIGRKTEEEAINEQLVRNDVRLLTLTGPGGTGKTRLSLEIAANLLAEFQDGVFFMPLAAITDPALVASEIAQTLGVKESGDTPIRDALKNHLQSKQMLLVLDNFEQIVAAAPLVSELLSACPQLKILVTSRVILHVRGEQEFPVQPLELPDIHYLPSLASLSQYSAVELFIDRARAIKQDFAITEENAPAIAEICARLDGLPLAIELAAARIKLLSPKSMLARLDNRLKLLVGGASDLPARQQTMRATIDWSYDLLNADEQKLFRSLTVFVDGFTLAAAEALIDQDQGVGLDILDGLSSLVNQSLIRQREEVPDEQRFSMLETIREYGSEKLKSAGEASTVRRSHAAYFLNLAERAEPELSGANQALWFNRLEAEHDNVRAALKFALESDDPETAARLSAAFWRFWLVRGYLSEGREELNKILSAAALSNEVRAKLLTGAATLAQNQGPDCTSARALFEESLAIWRQLGDKKGIATSLHNLGWIAWRQNDYTVAYALSNEALALHRELGNKQGMAHALNNLGWVAHHRGDFAAARSFHEQSLAIRRELGDQRAMAFALTNLAWAIQKQGDYEQALALLEEARRLFKHVGDKQLLAFSSLIMASALHECGDRAAAEKLLTKSISTGQEIGSKYNVASNLRILGDVLFEEGDQSRAVDLIEKSLSLFREIGDKYGEAFGLCDLANIAIAQGESERAASLLQQSLALRTEIGDKHGIIECIEGLAQVAATQNKAERAVRLISSAESLRESLQIHVSPIQERRLERVKIMAQANLDEQIFSDAWRNGRALTLDQAILEAQTLHEEVNFQSQLNRLSSDTQAKEGTVFDILAGAAVIKVPNNLPSLLTPVIGRQAEAETIKKQLRRDDLRLLTLTGPGGTGKTRLSLKVAADLLDEFPDGVFFVALAAIHDSALVASTIAQTLGVKEAAGSELLEQLKGFLSARQMLLLIDNFEQVIAAAPLVGELLNASPKLKVLVTSREPLRISGEHEFAVQPLAVPASDDLPNTEALFQYPAIELFLARAAAVKPDFCLTSENARAIAEICARLDGLPLAIELAAARTKILTPQALLARLESRLKLLTGGTRDLPSRQQTMRGAIAWSYELLSEEEKKLFRRLAVFLRGAELKTIAAVCDAGDLEIDVLDGVASLVDKSLLRQSGLSDWEPRFTMLETMTEFGLEQLETAGEANQLKRSHASVFLAFAQQAEKELLGAHPERWLDKFEVEHDNLRAALRWCEQNDETDLGLELATSVWRFWELRGYWTEGRACLTGLLSITEKRGDTNIRLKGLYAAGILADAQCDYRAAKSLFEEKLRLHQTLGDEWGVANSINNLGIIALRESNYSEARSLYEKSLALWRGLGNEQAVALALGNLGNVADLTRDFDVACRRYEESLEIFRKLDDRRGVAFSLGRLGNVARHRREFEAARAFYNQSLSILLELGDKRGAANLFADMGSLSDEIGQDDQARRFHEESMVIFCELGDVRGIAQLLESYAQMANVRGRFERAMRLAAAAAAMREKFSVKSSPAEDAKLQSTLTGIRQNLGESASKSAWSVGLAMPTERAIEYALSADTL